MKGKRLYSPRSKKSYFKILFFIYSAWPKWNYNTGSINMGTSCNHTHTLSAYICLK